MIPDSYMNGIWMDGPLTSDLYDPEGADPGFPVGGGAEPTGDGAPTYDFAKFKKKLYEIEKSLGHGGVPERPLTVQDL